MTGKLKIGPLLEGVGDRVPTGTAGGGVEHDAKVCQVPYAQAAQEQVDEKTATRLVCNEEFNIKIFFYYALVQEI